MIYVLFLSHAYIIALLSRRAEAHRTWIYPSQINGLSMVPLGKLSSWFLLMTISYVMVAWVNKPQAYRKGA